MFELGPEKLLTLLVICLVLFGGRRLPEIGGAIGKGIREFKRGMSDLSDNLQSPERPRDTEQGNGEGSEPKRLLGTESGGTE
jgi:sec-independent protein translocase protein TatA